MNFRYRLDGHDRDWQDAGTRREAFYTELGPGKYRFRVIACNNNGVWNEAGAALDFVIAPAFYQTVWFRALGVFLFIAALAVAYRFRLRHLERQRDALRQSEKELRDVIDTIPAIVWSTRNDGSNTYLNRRFIEYSGLSTEQTTESGWKAAVHPDDLERQKCKWMDAIATGKPIETEVRLRRSDGQYRWQLDRGVPLRDEDGNIVRWYGVVTDIEDRKRAEEDLTISSRDLRESKAKLEEAQRITHVGYWEWDLITNAVTWSDETYRIYGMRPQECPMDLASVREKIHPEDWGIVSRALEEALGGGARYNAECRVFRLTGEVRIVYTQGDVKRNALGRPVLMFGTVQDITDRRRAEDALQLVSSDLQESKAKLEEAQRITHVGYWERDLATDRITWSDETYRIYGLRPQEHPMDLAALGQKIHPEDRKLLSQALDEALGGGARYDIELRVVRPSGEIRTVHSTGDVKKDASGKPYRMFGTVQDITDRKRAGEELRRSQFYLSEGQRLAQMGSWAFNPAGFFDYWSEELFRMYGLDPQNGVPTLEQYLAIVHPQDRDSMADTIKGMHAERRGCDVKKRIVRPDGEERYIRYVGIPVLEGERLTGFLGTAIDVTEQELLTRELERREAHLAEAQRLTHMGSWTINISTDEHFWSEEIFRIYEFDPRLKPAWSLVRDRVHPADRARLDQRRQLELTQTGWHDSEADFRIVLPDGRIKLIHTLAHPVMDASGQIVEVVGTTMDVTERKRIEDSLRWSESHLAEAQTLTHTGSWAWRSSDRKVVHLSGEFYRIYGFDPSAGAPTWEEYFERVHPEDRLKWTETVEQSIVKKSDYDQEFRILLPNRKIKWIRTVGHPVLSECGELEQFVGSSTDITDSKHAEQERERMRQLEAYLAHTNRISVLGEMAASLAHEIKQPIAAAITSANSCIEWLAHEPPNLDRARAAASKIDKYGNRAAEIIDRIRSFYKKSPPQRELVDVNAIIQEILTLLEGETDPIIGGSANGTCS